MKRGSGQMSSLGPGGDGGAGNGSNVRNKKRRRLEKAKKAQQGAPEGFVPKCAPCPKETSFSEGQPIGSKNELNQQCDQCVNTKKTRGPAG